MAMKSAVLVFPGINRERDMARALKLASGHEPVRWSGTPRPRLPKGTDLVVVPGGFSYGDYLRCGAIAARAPDHGRGAGARGAMAASCSASATVSRSCAKSGLLPGVLMRNARLKFICQRRASAGRALGYAVHARLQCRAGDPRAGGAWRGQLRGRRRDRCRRLEGEGRVLYRYCSATGEVGDTHNINGAAASIAGIVSEKGNVLGMMPHPENHVEDIMGNTDGRGLFAGLVAHLESAA
jgi:phosphoribosylformylglycinamidine (FGAM) synthase-like amidotransferase family enzyme